jgi:uncharacterized protein YqjF (DUF2071 family)
MKTSIFLTAEWRNLIMANYEIDPSVLKPLLPEGLELDFHHGKTFVSIVGFNFLKTRVLGLPVPFHTDFEEVNLRFYVRRKMNNSWRRGVVFVRELVPRWAIAFIAKVAYGEPYSALPMRHRLGSDNSGIKVEFSWRRNHIWESVSASASCQPHEMAVGSEEEFICEHYWGYNSRTRQGCEFQIEHPRWRIRKCTEYKFDADVKYLYGDTFVEALSATPTSSFIAEGSPIVVRGKTPFSRNNGE